MNRNVQIERAPFEALSHRKEGGLMWKLPTASYAGSARLIARYLPLFLIVIVFCAVLLSPAASETVRETVTL